MLRYGITRATAINGRRGGGTNFLFMMRHSVAANQHQQHQRLRWQSNSSNADANSSNNVTTNQTFLEESLSNNKSDENMGSPIQEMQQTQQKPNRNKKHQSNNDSNNFNINNNRPRRQNKQQNNNDNNKRHHNKRNSNPRKKNNEKQISDVMPRLIDIMTSLRNDMPSQHTNKATKDSQVDTKLKNNDYNKSKNTADSIVLADWRRHLPKSTSTKNNTTTTSNDISDLPRQQQHQRFSPNNRSRIQRNHDTKFNNNTTYNDNENNNNNINLSERIKLNLPKQVPRREFPPSNRASFLTNLAQQHEQSNDPLNFLSGRTKQSSKFQQSQNNQTPPQQQDIATVTLPNSSLTLLEASTLLRIKAQDLRDTLKYSLGEKVDSNDNGTEYMLDVDLMELVAMEYGINTIRSETSNVALDQDAILLQRRMYNEMETNDNNTSKQLSTTESISPSSLLPPRPPVVCIMGHVDHGKTTLMDSLRQRAAAQQGGKKGSKKKGKKKHVATSKNENTTAADGNVAGTEAGGITQIISAFQVRLDNVDDGNDSNGSNDSSSPAVTFLDTPGHAAFKSMRQSGSHAADIIVLVIAADDGVSEQTIEILNFYKSIVKESSSNGISLVVALNKIDKPGIDVNEAKQRISNQLLQHDIYTEGTTAYGDHQEGEYGPPVQLIPTSGLTGLGLDELIEGVLLQSEIMDLRADPKALGEGIVMDARMEKGLGVVADCIMRWGSISRGSVVVSDLQIGTVRILRDVHDKQLKKGLPSQPVRIVGFESLPKAGDAIICVEDLEAAEELVRQRELAQVTNNDNDNNRPDDSTNVQIQVSGMRMRESRYSQRYLKRQQDSTTSTIDDSGESIIRIPVVVKADADGSLSAIRDSLVSLGADSKSPYTIIVDPVAEGIGPLTVNDIQMAKESEAAIFAFGQLKSKTDESVLQLAETENVSICSGDIIYSLLDEAREVMGTYLPPTQVEHVHGTAKVQAIFEIDGGDETIAGLQVTQGTLYGASQKASINSSSGSSSTTRNKNENATVTKLPCHYRVLRNGQIISTENEEASSLRRFKDVVSEMKMGQECGLGLKNFKDYKAGDVIECFSIEMKPVKL